MQLAAEGWQVRDANTTPCTLNLPPQVGRQRDRLEQRNAALVRHAAATGRDAASALAARRSENATLLAELAAARGRTNALSADAAAARAELAALRAVRCLSPTLNPTTRPSSPATDGRGAGGWNPARGRAESACGGAAANGRHAKQSHHPTSPWGTARPPSGLPHARPTTAPVPGAAMDGRPTVPVLDAFGPPRVVPTSFESRGDSAGDGRGGRAVAPGFGGSFGLKRLGEAGAAEAEGALPLLSADPLATAFAAGHAEGEE